MQLPCNCQSGPPQLPFSVGKQYISLYASFLCVDGEIIMLLKSSYASKHVLLTDRILNFCQCLQS